MFVKITTAIWLNGSKVLPENTANVRRRTPRGDIGMFGGGGDDGVRYRKVWTTNETSGYLRAISTNTIVPTGNRIPGNYHRCFCPRTISGDTDRKYYYYYYILLLVGGGLRSVSIGHRHTLSSGSGCAKYRRRSWRYANVYGPTATGVK